MLNVSLIVSEIVVSLVSSFSSESTRRAFVSSLVKQASIACGGVSITTARILLIYSDVCSYTFIDRVFLFLVTVEASMDDEKKVPIIAARERG